jgi:hypothetical protein
MGLSEVGFAMKKKCRLCGHQMSLHKNEEATTAPPAVVNTASVAQPQAAPIVPLPIPAPKIAEAPPMQPAAVSVATVSAASVADELMKLASLRDAGVLSDEEFAQEKARLLERPAAPATSGQPVAAEQAATFVESEQWKSSAVILRSDATPRAFLDAIANALESVEYPITERNYGDLKLVFESRGISWKSWSGDVTTVLVSATATGSKASFTSKAKPSGTSRIALKANATTWVERIIPGFGQLWRGPQG